MLVFLINLAVAESDRPELLTRSFDRNYLVKYLGTYNFTIYDAVQNVKSNSQRALADSSDVTDVENYMKTMTCRTTSTSEKPKEKRHLRLIRVSAILYH